MVQGVRCRVSRSVAETDAGRSLSVISQTGALRSPDAAGTGQSGFRPGPPTDAVGLPPSTWTRKIAKNRSAIKFLGVKTTSMSGVGSIASVTAAKVPGQRQVPAIQAVLLR